MINGNHLPKQIPIGDALNKITTRSMGRGGKGQNVNFVCLNCTSHTDSVVFRHSASNNGLPSNNVPCLVNNTAKSTELRTAREIGIITIIILIERRLTP